MAKKGAGKGGYKPYQVGEYDRMMDVVRRAHGEDAKKKRLEGEISDGFDRPSGAARVPAKTGGSSRSMPQTHRGPFGRPPAKHAKARRPTPGQAGAPGFGNGFAGQAVGQPLRFRAPLWMVRHIRADRAAELLLAAARNSPITQATSFDLRGDGSRIPTTGEETAVGFSYAEQTSHFHRLAKGAISEAGEGADFVDPDTTKTHVAVPLFSDPSNASKKKP